MVVLTIRDVPGELRDSLAEQAQAKGQSLQAFLLSVLHRQADFSRNMQVLAEVEADLLHGGGVSPDAPSAATVLDDARKASSRAPSSRSRAMK
jgi:hypothetical protein